MVKMLGILAMAFGFFMTTTPAHGLDYDLEYALAKVVVGIGVNADKSADGRFVIKSLIANGPAQKSGLLAADDEILAVQTAPGAPFVPVAGKTEAEVGGLIRGAEGVPVGLQIKRGVSVLTVSIVRGKFEAPE